MTTSGQRHSYRLVNLEVAEDGDEWTCDVDVDSLPWFGSASPAGCPLRANRSVFLPLWNNVDYSGELWRDTPSTETQLEDEEDEEDMEDMEDKGCPAVTVSELRDSFLSGRRGVATGVIRHRLIVRIINKSHLMYYGRTDRNCECPYKALLEVCDQTGSVCVVLWNSVCLSWYRCLKPGDIMSLRCYRVKRRYQAGTHDIEISVNSRNPAAQMSVLAESSISPEYLPPAPPFRFLSSKELVDGPHNSVCDVIGLLTFSGRAERIRSKEGRGAGLLQYRWLRLEDGMSDQPITVKLFTTSQPETHLKLHPLSVVVCTQLKLITCTEQRPACFYLTNTTYTQVYCTGLGHHSQMSYRKLRPVRQFLCWLRKQDDRALLSRALIGGFFIFPPPPISLETYMKDRRGEPGFLRGAELQRELERLCYRERRSFCIQATVTAVTYVCRGGEEDRRLIWTDRASSSLSPSSSSSSPPPFFHSTPSSLRTSLSSSSSPPSSSLSPSSSSFSPSSSLRKSRKRKRLQTEAREKRPPCLTLQPEHHDRTEILFDASMEFVEDAEDEEEDEDASSFVTTALPPTFPSVAMETLPMRYSHAHREEQAVAVGMGGRVTPGKFGSVPEDYYTLRLRALSDGVTVSVVFLPHASSASPSPHPHPNTWTSILSHGAFSSHRPPPSPADLIAMAAQLTNQRLVCILEACHLGGASTELVLSRAFQLTDV
ncbi:RPA-related protein RADX isoform X2 [Mugil cephalus]|nr:RPA-related protein RADX isoform X2 [Mugil cephalus]